MSITANLSLQHTINNSLSIFDSSRSTIVHDGMNLTAQLNASSSVPVTKYAAVAKALSAGAATIDLSALTDDSGTAIGTGLKVQSVILYNPSANVITIGIGASNGYPLFGASALLPIEPGARLIKYFNDALIDIDGTHKNLDLAGTLAQTLNVGFTFG